MITHHLPAWSSLSLKHGLHGVIHGWFHNILEVVSSFISFFLPLSCRHSMGSQQNGTPLAKLWSSNAFLEKLGIFSSSVCNETQFVAWGLASNVVNDGVGLTFTCNIVRILDTEVAFRKREVSFLA